MLRRGFSFAVCLKEEVFNERDFVAFAYSKKRNDLFLVLFLSY